MLRINLLPGYVLVRRRNRQVAALFTGLFVALTAVTLAWYLALKPQPAEIEAKVQEGTAMQTQIQNVNTQATNAISSLGQINTNLQSYQAIQAFNLAYPELYQRVVSYTSSRVLYNGMATSGTTLSISGYTPSLGDLGRYLQLMYTEPDASAISLTSAIPGLGSPDPDVPETIAIPNGVIAHLPGYPRPITSYTVLKGRIVSVNTGGAGTAGAAGRFGGAPGGVTGFSGRAALPQQQFGAGRPPGMSQGFGAQGAFGAAGRTSGKMFDARHDGFPFSVSLVLKAPLSPPSPNGTAATTGAQGAGGPGGPPGGFGGPPGAPGGPGFNGGAPPGAPQMRPGGRP